ncbi:hypothetical protein ISF_06788 [Cordyceps fumosorosea ARSEF 2679]|uniref:Uncharacterized protein n=1 Tax=Cordyceps fumosorosea (strain ARSEF 2679) TaxID=1081104 RepID=A0A167R3Y5_CORFA|nr:hypothetical protein ISF_06788 [Cordyceps fumosorosea ARSEF 2679]OAA58249.1 hypothetical protein ISF_06788 [Cordyceps fumosorosea ARSEF 2679]
MSFYPVFLVQEHGEPRKHHSLWVQTANARGVLFNVIGPVDNGAMQYERKPTFAHPSNAVAFAGMTEIGHVAESHPAARGRGLPRKSAAAHADARRRATLPSCAARRCQEWMAETIGLLKTAGNSGGEITVYDGLMGISEQA